MTRGGRRQRWACAKTVGIHGKTNTPLAGGALSVERRIAALAAEQHGVVTRTQLLATGLRAGAIEHRLRAGRLHRLHAGVYAVGHVPPSPHARAMAAVLACGRGAVLSHRSAGALWEITPPSRGEVHVTAQSLRRRAGVRVHRSRSLTAADVTVHYGIPVTTAARTMLDLAAQLHDPALARAVNEARVVQRVRVDQLEALIARCPGPSTARLRRFTATPGAPTRSALEDAFLTFVARHGLPRPQVNQIVAGHRVDMVWNTQHLVAELDGVRYHETNQAFERDRDRDADLLVAGYSVIRITWKRLTVHPQCEADRLHRLLIRKL